MTEEEPAAPFWREGRKRRKFSDGKGVSNSAASWSVMEIEGEGGFSESLEDDSMEVLSGGVVELLQKLREFHGEALIFERVR